MFLIELRNARIKNEHTIEKISCPWYLNKEPDLITMNEGNLWKQGEINKE